MILRSPSLHRLAAPLLPAFAVFLFVWLPAAPAQATVSTIFTCPSSGHDGNHDIVENGFHVTLNGSNLHTIQIFYTTNTDGTYQLALTARRGSYAGPLVATQSQTVALSSSSDSAVTWTLGDAAITPGDTIYFTHTENGPGGVEYNLQPTVCTGDEESVGTSSFDNGISVATTITQNVTTPPPSGCVASDTTLCIDDKTGDKRFQIRVTYSTSQGGGLSGNGHAIPLSSLGITQGGIFWFFSSTNPELLIKVIDACTVNSRFWVYFSAGTNVGYHLTVTDTKTGHTASYTNPDLTEALPVQDTSTLTCP
jgi:hypothetical protein